jgi:lipid-A-disaccharide synthase-like uncharacterized protein
MLLDWFASWVWVDHKFLGIEWGVWKVVGWVGNLVFFSRFFVQWWATEKHKRVVVPDAFWYLSLAGSLLLLIYSLHQRDSVFIFAYVFTWIPYIRSLIISHRVARGLVLCGGCSASSPPGANFCAKCGTRLAVPAATKPEWDQQIGEDIRIGRLDKFPEETLREKQEGKTRPAPE